MKYITCYILLSLLGLMTKPSFSQDFWEIVPTPDSANPWNLTINKNGDIFSGSNGIYLSHDQGQNWEYKGLFGMLVASIAIDSSDNIFVGDGVHMYKSTNYGDNWEVVENVPGSLPLAFCSNGTMLAGGKVNAIGYLFRTKDYGISWDTVYIFQGAYEEINDILVCPDGDYYVATVAWMGGGGGVYRSANHGATLEHIGLLDHFVFDLAINSVGDLFAASYGQYYSGIGGCYRYNYEDSTWTDLTVNLNADAIVINSNDDIYLGISNAVGGPGGVYRSFNGGQTWQWINSGLSGNSIERLFISPDDYIYALTYSSHTLNKTINSTVTSINNDIIIPEIKIFPNPFSNEFYVTVNPYSQHSKIVLTIFDMKGRIIRRIDLMASDNLPLTVINGRDWPRGIYCYYLILDNTCQSGKLLKIN